MIWIAQWSVSPVATKKYRVLLNTGKHVDFGDRRYQQYKDQTPLKAYAHLDHKDTERKKRYYARHNKDYPPYSADWLSKKYLW